MELASVRAGIEAAASQGSYSIFVIVLFRVMVPLRVLDIALWSRAAELSSRWP